MSGTSQRSKRRLWLATGSQRQGKHLKSFGCCQGYEAPYKFQQIISSKRDEYEPAMRLRTVGIPPRLPRLSPLPFASWWLWAKPPSLPARSKARQHINGREAESICRKCESWCQLIGNQQVFITKVSKHSALRGKSWKWGQHNGYVSQSVTQIQDCIHRRSSQSGQSPVWKQNQDGRVQGIDCEEQQKAPKADFQLFEPFGLQAHSHGDDAAQQLQPRLLWVDYMQEIYYKF